MSPVRKRFDREPCSIARALEVLGDWWTLLVVREAFLGARRFVDFERRLPIAKNILARRLAHLVAHGVLEQVDAGVHGSRHEYVLGKKGKDLVTVITALRQWGDRWVFGPGAEPLLVIDRRTGRPIPRLRLADEQGQPIPADALEVRPGPGLAAAAAATNRARRPRARRATSSPRRAR